MLYRLRHPRSGCRRLASLLACAALLAHALVPAGFMLGIDGDSGDISIVLCPSDGGLPPGHPPVAGHGEHADGHASGDAPIMAAGELCEFGLTGAPLLAALPAGQQPEALVATDQPKTAHQLPLPNHVPARTVARGPPRHT